MAKKGIEALREYINHEAGSESALQEAVIAASKILRKYPKKHESLIKDVCAQVERIDEPESKAALIWILGEFAEKIEKPHEILQRFIDSFADETTFVCLQVITAAVKMYIKNDEIEELVMNVLRLATEESDNPDLRDRGYIYWRMLYKDPTATRDVVLAKRPEYFEDLTKMMSAEVRDIFDDASVEKKQYKMPEIEEHKGDDEIEVEEEPQEEEPKKKEKKKKKDKKDKKEKNNDNEEKNNIEEEEVISTTTKPSTDIDDILGLGGSGEPAPSNDAAFDPLADIFGPSTSSNGVGASSTSAAPAWDAGDLLGGALGTPVSSVSPTATFVKPKWSEVLSPGTAGQGGSSGLKINGRFYRDASQIKLELEITNTTSSMISDFEIMLNKNSFGITPGTLSVVPISGGSTFNTTVTCSINPSNADQKNPPTCPYMVQTAIK